jgi:NDP-sugar pyrophosphorylase family protein
VLAGGRATRIADTLRGRSKASLPLVDSGQSLLELLVVRAGRMQWPCWVVAEEPKYNDFFQSHVLRSASVRWIPDAGRGTADALSVAVAESTCERFLLMNCDTLIPFDPFGVALGMPATPPAVHISAHLSNQNSGLIGASADGRVLHWGETDKSPPSPDLLPVSSTGAYVLRRDFIATRLKGLQSLEEELMPRLASSGELWTITGPSLLPVVDYGTDARYQQLMLNHQLRMELLATMGLSTEGTVSDRRH